MSLAALLLAGLGCAILLAGRLHLLLHLLQQEHYELARLRVWVARRGERIVGRELEGIACVAIGIGVLALISEAGMLVVGAFGAGYLGAAGRRTLRREQVKPLVFTPRARRLFALSLTLATLLAVAPTLIVAALAGAAAGAFSFALWGVAAHLAAPEALALADFLLRPVQRAGNARFERRARQRLAAVDPLVIGITGSYGKTTTKGCVARIADLAGPSYPTPGSFNSWLGVIRAINEGLESRHRSFVVEMGAYRRGDIAELCELVEPRIGILTAIGPAHLERFGSLEATAEAKGELAEALPPDGLFVTRADDERCRSVVARTEARTALFAPRPHPDASVWAEDVRMERGRSRFALCRDDGGDAQRFPVRARLLGEANVANLVAAAVVGFELGISGERIAQALAAVPPPEHRLATIVNEAAGVVVIDDTYNSNPEGARSALEVLRRHPADRRVLVTPGMVELGSDEEKENERFGELAAAAADSVVLVGDGRTDPIRRGLLGAGFPEADLEVVANLSEAQALLARLTRPGDVILFENDLPDLYRKWAPTAEPA